MDTCFWFLVGRIVGSAQLSSSFSSAEHACLRPSVMYIIHVIALYLGQNGTTARQLMDDFAQVTMGLYESEPRLEYLVFFSIDSLGVLAETDLNACKR